jgi:hypothetical protein
VHSKGSCSDSVRLAFVRAQLEKSIEKSAVPWSNTIPLEANTRNAKNAAEVHVDGEAGRDEGGPAGREN